MNINLFVLFYCTIREKKHMTYIYLYICTKKVNLKNYNILFIRLFVFIYFLIKSKILFNYCLVIYL